MWEYVYVYRELLEYVMVVISQLQNMVENKKN